MDNLTVLVRVAAVLLLFTVLVDGKSHETVSE